MLVCVICLVGSFVCLVFWIAGSFVWLVGRFVGWFVLVGVFACLVLAGWLVFACLFCFGRFCYLFGFVCWSGDLVACLFWLLWLFVWFC